MTLRSAYFDRSGIGGTPNLLLWGDADGISELSAILHRLALTNEDRFALTRIGEQVDGKAIIIRKSPSPLGLLTCPGGFEWALDAETLEWFSDLTSALARGNTPGHQYLETRGSGQITVLVSRDEYPDDFRPGLPAEPI